MMTIMIMMRTLVMMMTMMMMMRRRLAKICRVFLSIKQKHFKHTHRQSCRIK